MQNIYVSLPVLYGSRNHERSSGYIHSKNHSCLDKLSTLNITKSAVSFHMNFDIWLIIGWLKIIVS